MADTDEDVNVLGLSDDEVMDMPLDEDIDTAPEQEQIDEKNEVQTNSEQEVGDRESDKQEEEVTEPDTEGGEDPSTQNRDSNEGGGSSSESVDQSREEDGTSGGSEGNSSKEEKTKKEENLDGIENNDESPSLDAQAQLDLLFTPFRANGKEIKITNVADAISLMQMGANYNKKMAGIKPAMKLMKKLENNDLLDESKLDFLIDLDKKNPEAIKKLMKDANIDPLEVDLDKAAEYTPSTYTVNDMDVELDMVLEDIKSSEFYSTTIDIIGNKWDASSKKILREQPNLIKVINDHVASGVYEQIASVIESERMLGRLQGISDLDAYKQVGDAIQARGGFANQQSKPNATEKTINKPEKKVEDHKLNDKRRAASSSKSTAGGGIKKDEYNPLSMSDDDFEKATAGEFV